MSEYYAVIRSTDHLAHYGVKGMKWGVRKAIEKGNAKRLARNFAKAEKKLNKLNIKADKDRQLKKANKYAKIAGVGMGIGLAGTGISAGSDVVRAMNRKKYKAAQEGLKEVEKVYGDLYRKAAQNPLLSYETVNTIKQPYEKGIIRYNNQKNEAINKINNASKAKKVGAIVNLGGIAVGGAAGLASLKARYNASDKGHAKAVAKRDAWRNEMDNAFAGTKYQGQYATPSKQKKRRK